MSGHGAMNKTVNEDQSFHLQMPRIKMILITVYKESDAQKICSWKEKRKWQTVNSKYRYWKDYLSVFSGWSLKFWRETVVFFVRYCPCSFFHENEGLPGELWHDANQPLTLFTWPCASSLLLFPEVKTALKRRTFQNFKGITKEHNC
jgi:hypothetical protein